ncbi:hypothetical protein [Mucilaginibacter humi]|uniref:hypothetical protein n=1 Tax=Mucilaginibacter humi TaxID=2732510 RepID=UPI001FE47464|nr:hypothetical protein [Mucilaginibacter humi]
MRKFGIVVLSVVLFASAANAQQKIVLDKIVAVVGNSVILKSDIELLNAQYVIQNVHPDKCLLARA